MPDQLIWWFKRCIPSVVGLCNLSFYNQRFISLDMIIYHYINIMQYSHKPVVMRCQYLNWLFKVASPTVIAWKLRQMYTLRSYLGSEPEHRPACARQDKEAWIMIGTSARSHRTFHILSSVDIQQSLIHRVMHTKNMWCPIGQTTIRFNGFHFLNTLYVPLGLVRVITKKFKWHDFNLIEEKNNWDEIK